MIIKLSINLMILVFVVAVLSIGAVYHEEGYTFEEVENLTSSINWNETTLNPAGTELQGAINGSLGLRTQSRYQGLIERTVDWVGFSMFEMTKWGVEYGYTHPNYNYATFFTLIKVLIVFSIAFYAFYPVLFSGFFLIKAYSWLKSKVEK